LDKDKFKSDIEKNLLKLKTLFKDDNEKNNYYSNITNEKAIFSKLLLE